jgi:hypothetical protein
MRLTCHLSVVEKAHLAKASIKTSLPNAKRRMPNAVRDRPLDLTIDNSSPQSTLNMAVTCWAKLNNCSTLRGNLQSIQKAGLATRLKSFHSNTLQFDLRKLLYRKTLILKGVHHNDRSYL